MQQRSLSASSSTTLSAAAWVGPATLDGPAAALDIGSGVARESALAIYSTGYETDEAERATWLAIALLGGLEWEGQTNWASRK